MSGPGAISRGVGFYFRSVTELLLFGIPEKNAGTIDPGSIGQQKSMGCIRMGDEDIQLVFELMGEQVSVVKIVP